MPSSVDNFLAEQFLPDKFWLHRTNSVGKQKEFAGKYAGLEFDIIFYEKELAFENSHDKENLTKFNFEEQLKNYYEFGKNNGMWLDFKNLTDSNKKDSLLVLEKLLLKYEVDKSNIWVESSNWKALKIFQDAGYNTSYYFPYYDFKKMGKEDIEKAKQLTQVIANSGNVDAISFYGGYYDFVNSIELPPRIALLSWLNGHRWFDVLLSDKFATIRNDERIKVILVTENGLYSR